MKFGPDGTGSNGPPVVYGQPVPPGTGTAVSTSSKGVTTTTDPEAAIVAAATAASFPETYALWIDEGMGWSASHTIGMIPALAAAYTADPGLTPGQLATQVLGATPQQAAAIQKTDQANQASAGTSSGLMSDIFGDFFQVFYPFLMIGLSVALFVLWALIALIAINKASAG